MGKKNTDADAPPKQVNASWYTIPVEAVISELEFSRSFTTTGWSTFDAARCDEKYGLTKMTEPEQATIWQKIWHQVVNVLGCIH